VLGQLREQLVVSALVPQQLEQALQRVQAQQVQLRRARLQKASKYSEQQPASVLVEHQRLELQQAFLPMDCSGSRSPTLQVLKIDLLGIARTFLLRANHLHRNLVLKTLSAPLRSHFHRPAG
jgi:hypothetical protein